MINNRHIIDIIGSGTQQKLIVVGGMHGNETSGIDAINNVISDLKKYIFHNKSIYFVKGNTRAIEKNERFIEKDLNRLWLDKYIIDKNNAFEDVIELKEMHRLIENDICNHNFENCIFLDLHTFSARSGVFCIPSGNENSIEFAKSFGMPFIEKLSDMLPGTALGYFGKKGVTSVVVEGGTHDSVEAVKNLEASLWHTLAYFNFIDEHSEIVQKNRAYLYEISEKYPHHLELIYRHKLEKYHNFAMQKGYYNFKKISKEETLAVQNENIIKSPSDGYMLMPLYQKKGSDGFFIVKEKINNLC